MKYVRSLALAPLAFCFICGFRLAVGCCVVVESTRVVGGICSDVAFLVGEQELHVILNAIIDGR